MSRNCPFCGSRKVLPLLGGTMFECDSCDTVFDRSSRAIGDHVDESWVDETVSLSPEYMRTPTRGPRTPWSEL